MLFLDGVYVDHPKGAARFHWVKALTSQDLTQLVHTIAQRVGRFLERQGLLERDAENSYLASDEDAMTRLVMSLVFPCTPAWWPGLMNVRSLSGCAVTSAVERIKEQSRKAGPAKEAAQNGAEVRNQTADPEQTGKD